ncbi:MAG: Gfo/Idh/MocA family oxidoreductase, partial [Puniceicoccales bacterium]|nr:Gfo/Idh/MocA family oxidoreductase [Puniceicoccales bacterium]
MSSSPFSRRSFLKTAAAAAVPFILPSGFLRGQNAPSNRLNVAVVGIGGQGRMDLRGVRNAGASIVAVCDVQSDRLAVNAKFAGLTAERLFADYRVMFDKLGKDIDAAIVATPDHAHFTVALDAMQQGKHVYVQKPLCHSVDQVRRLAKAAIDTKVVTSMGNQGHSSSHIRMVREWFEAGLFGKISKIDAWDGQFKADPKRYAASAPTPAALNWDLWLGPAQMR